MTRPYRTTPTFDQDSLPAALRREHRTRAGVWAVIRVIEGRLRLRFSDGSPEQLLTPQVTGLIEPEQSHSVEPIGRVRMCIDFFDAPPGMPTAGE